MTCVRKYCSVEKEVIIGLQPNQSNLGGECAGLLQSHTCMASYTPVAFYLPCYTPLTFYLSFLLGGSHLPLLPCTVSPFILCLTFFSATLSPALHLPF